MRMRFIPKILLLVSMIIIPISYAEAATQPVVSTSAALYYPTLNTVGGNPAGKVTIVEFFDYSCGYCHELYPILNSIRRDNHDVRIVYRDYPMLGADSLLAADLALAAQLQGKYLAVHDKLFTLDAPLDKAMIQEIVRSHGLEPQKLMNDMYSAPVKQQLRENRRLADSIGVNGIPTVFVAATPNREGQATVQAEELISPSYSELQAAIADARK